MAKIGIIGGSGMDDPNLIKDIREEEVVTPYGRPSSPLTFGSIGALEVVILSRHGKNHSIYPTGVNYRANIHALKAAGCSHILATTAVGSLRQEIAPGHLVFPDQFIDFTKHRAATFHEEDVVHTPMSDPFCRGLRDILVEKALQLGLPHHSEGTVVTIEGPRFSTRAESHMFRTLGADVINMSTVPEVTLACEAGLCYQSIAMSTDYDCWKDDEAPVTWEMILQRMSENVGNVKKLLLAAMPEVPGSNCGCGR